MKKATAVCPYCGSGCKINLLVDKGNVIAAEVAKQRTGRL